MIEMHAQHCAFKPTCQTRAEMTKRHGTPAQFRKDAWNAIGEISVSEAQWGADAYEREWCSAPETRDEHG